MYSTVHELREGGAPCSLFPFRQARRGPAYLTLGDLPHSYLLGIRATTSFLEGLLHGEQRALEAAFYRNLGKMEC